MVVRLQMESVAGPRLVGRAEEIRLVIESIREGSGAWIIGEPGVGKTAVAQAVVKELAGEVRSFNVRADPTLAGYPYGALAPLLTNVGAHEAHSPIAITRTLLARFSSGDGAGDYGPALLVVDDAHHLDEATADLIMQLVASTHIRALLLSRPPRSISSTLWPMDVDGLLDRHSLEPLGGKQVHELAQRVLGGRVVTATSAALARGSRGNPLYILHLIAQAQRRKLLVVSNDVWLLKDALIPTDLRLEEFLERQLSGLSSQDREALELAALAGPVPLSVLFELGMHGSVDALTEMGLIAVGRHPQRLVIMRHPLVSDVLRRSIPAGRSLKLRQQVIERAHQHSSPAQAMLREVLWSLDNGTTVPELKLLEAAAAANDLSEPAVALRLACAIRTPGLLEVANLHKVVAHGYRGEHQCAGLLLAEVARNASQLETVRRGALLSAELQHYLDKTVDQLDNGPQAWLKALERILGHGTTEPESLALKAARRSCDLLQLQSDLSQGYYAGALERSSSILASAESSGDVDGAILAMVLAGAACTLEGRAEAGAGFTDRALQLIVKVGTTSTVTCESVLLRHIPALDLAGRWNEVLPLLDDYAEGSWSAPAYRGGAIDLVICVTYMRRGHYDQALEMVIGSIEGLRYRHVANLHPLALGLGAYVSAWIGDHGRAQGYLEEFDEAEPETSAPIRLVARAYCAAARMIITPSGGGEAFRDLGLEAESNAWYGAEFEIRFLGLGAGQTDHIDRLLKLGEIVEGQRAAMLASYCQAARDRNVVGLMAIADTALVAGDAALNRMCLQESSRLADLLGDRVIQQQARRLLAERQISEPGLRDTVHPTSLTRREGDIAAMVIQGKRNAEIADEFSLSVRTVEGHVYRIFEKLGIRRREHLTADHLLPGNISPRRE